MTKQLILSALVLASVCGAAQAEDKLTVTPMGRVLMDGALYASPDKENFKDGVGVPDVRLGLKATYGKWDARIDVGYAYGKVGLKDIYVRYNFDDENALLGGSFIHQYGLMTAYSSSWKPCFDDPIVNSSFMADRHLGIEYIHSGKKFFASASAHVEPQSIILTPNQTNHQGYGFLTRLVCRPATEPGRIFQVGISGGFLTPQNDGEGRHNVFSLGSNFPTSVDKVSAVNAEMGNAMNQWKFSPELMVAYGPVALEAQYYFNRVNMRHDLHNFTGMGAYGMLRGLLSGGDYKYSAKDARIAEPGKGTFELVLLYNYTKLSDRKAGVARVRDHEICGIYGGDANSLSATLNYYINKYMTARLNYTYTHTFNGAPLCTDFNGFQARFQILF